MRDRSAPWCVGLDEVVLRVSEFPLLQSCAFPDWE